MKRISLVTGLTSIAVLSSTILALPTQAQTVEWIRQLGGPFADPSYAVTTDKRGNVYISGETFSDLASTNAGQPDAWLAKYDDKGNLLWKQQLGTVSGDYSRAIATDKDGNAYIAGYTYGSFTGNFDRANFSDAFVAKYDTNGNLLWKQQLGTRLDDIAYGVATDKKGNVYISGSTGSDFDTDADAAGGQDAWIAKYDNNGNRLWLRQTRNVNADSSRGVDTDKDGNVYISGSILVATIRVDRFFSYLDFDAFVTKYDTNGNLLWNQQLGNSSSDNSKKEDFSQGVATDRDGNVYISGYTGGDLAGTNAGDSDAWVAKYNTNGILQWKQQLGTSAQDSSNSVATDNRGDVYISGSTTGNLAGTYFGAGDAFVVKYNTNGTLQWKQQLGTSTQDISNSVATDKKGEVYISGATFGNLTGTNAGATDAFVVKYKP